MNQPALYGTSNPSYLKAPRPLDFDDGKLLRGIYCYVIRHYGRDGIGVLYFKRGDELCVQLGDWDGNTLDLDDRKDPLVEIAVQYLTKHNIPMLNMLHTIGIGQAQLFLNRELMLCDVQTAVNKLVGPGMLKDIFSNVIATPEVKIIETLDQRIIDVIHAGTGSYAGDLILKPSRFRIHQSANNAYVPLYAQVSR